MSNIFKIVYNYFGDEREVEAIEFFDGSIAVKGLDFYNMPNISIKGIGLDGKLCFFESLEEFFSKFKGVRCVR